MDICEIVKTDKYAMCCRNKEEMLWLERQLQELGITWMSGNMFELTPDCWHTLDIYGDCSFGCNSWGQRIRMTYAYSEFYSSLEDRSRIIVEVVNLMPSINYTDLLNLL